MKENLNTGFGPLKNAPTVDDVDYTKDTDIVDYEEEDYVEKTGEGEKDYTVCKRVVEVSRKNRAQYIASFADDVGIQNILKKVAITGDTSLLGSPPTGGFTDYTVFPTNKEAMFDAVKNGVDAFDSLPDDIKKKMSMESFVNSFGEKEFNEYINSKVNEIIVARKAAEEKEKGESK